MAKVVSLINMKGGVGKSTLTVNLAWWCSERFPSSFGCRVLVVDLDPQFNASQYLVGQSEYRQFLSDGKPTIWDIFEQHTRTPAGKVGRVDPKDAVRNVMAKPFGNVYHSAHPRLVATASRKIDLIPSRLDLALSLQSPARKEGLLAKALDGLKDEYELILVDCPPTESFLTKAAYLASDYILVPVKPEYLSTIGLPLLVNSMRDFKEEHEDHRLELAGIVFNGTQEYEPEERIAVDEVTALAKKYGWYVFRAKVPYSKSYPKGARQGSPIYRTSHARRAPMMRFREFAEEFAERVGL